jgi:hypothetical protein
MTARWEPGASDNPSETAGLLFRQQLNNDKNLMKLVQINDRNNRLIAINPAHIVRVTQYKDDDGKCLTSIEESLGEVVITADSLGSVIDQINAALKA